MKYTKFLLLYILTLLSSSVYSSYDYIDGASAISLKVSKQLEKKYQMRLIGEGGGMIDAVNKINLSFQIHRDLNFEEARLIFTDCVETLIAAVNADEKLRPYLRNYPFLPENVRIAIHISDREGSDRYYPFVALVSSFNDQVSYACYDKDIQPLGYKADYTESYDNALKEAKRDRVLNPLLLKEMPPIPTYLQAMSNVVEKIKKALKDRYDLSLNRNYIIFGDRKLERLQLTFDSNSQDWTQDEARKLILKCTGESLDIVNQDTTIQPHLQIKPFTVDALSLNLVSSLYKKKNKNLEEISSVIINKGKITYWHYNNPSNIAPKATETYQEALSLDQHP